MTKEERQQKFLKEHPKFNFWQEFSHNKEFIYKKKEIEIYQSVDYFKNISKQKKIEAQQLMYMERRSGRIVAQPCEICGKKKNIQGHHENYDKPLEVIWLCHKHHRARHKELNRKLVKVIKRVLVKNKNINKISRQEGLSTV